MRSGLVRCFLASVALAGCTGTVGGDGSSPSAQASSGATASSQPGVGVSGSPGGTSGPAASTGSGFGTPVGAPAQCTAAPLATGNAYVRRLTHWEYTNTVSD